MTLGPLMVDVAGTSLTSADREILAHPLVGGVILFSRNYANPGQVRELVSQSRPRLQNKSVSALTSGSKLYPECPSVMSFSIPERRLHRTGVPLRNASGMTSGNPSHLDGTTNASAAA